MQRDEHAARYKARILREHWRFDSARRRIAQFKFPDDANYGQFQVFAVRLADRKSLAKINTKRSGRRLIQDGNGAVVTAQKATPGQRKTTQLTFRDRINSEDIDVQESIARNHIAEHCLPRNDRTVTRSPTD